MLYIVDTTTILLIPIQIIIQFGQHLLPTLYKYYNKRRENKIHDLIKVKAIGAGKYSRVYMSYDKYNGKIYALKEMNIKLVAMTNNVKHILHEKKILSELHHPFIINLLDYYKDDLNLYYVLEFCHGCDLFSVLVRIYGGKEDASKFSITQKVIEHGKAVYVLKIEIVKVFISLYIYIILFVVFIFIIE